MMKITDKFLSAVMLTAAALCASCSTENLTEQQQEQPDTKAVSLTATIDDAITRTGLGHIPGYANKALCYWHKGDKILVQTQNTDGTYAGTKFYTTDATGSTTATFWGEPLSGATLGGVALYPYNENHQFFNATDLIYNLPASYTYTTVGQEIFYNTKDDGTNNYPTNSTNVPMVGKISDGSVAFQYLGGLVVIRVDAMPFEAGTLTVSADQQLSGDFTVDDLTVDNPVIATASTETTTDKQVTFTFSGATENGVGVFYLPLATGEYTNLTVTISDSDGANTQTIPYGTLNMLQGNVWALSITTHDGYLRNVHKIANGNYIVNGREFADLGLPSGTLWATMNVGASSATDKGTYFAWGETTGKDSWQWSNYAHGTADNIAKYTVPQSTLDAEDDAATVHWGKGFRMPTVSEFAELCDASNCTWTWDGTYLGCTITGTNGSSIFLSAAGYKNNVQDMHTGSNGYYWTNTLGTGINGAINLYFTSDGGTCGMGEGHDRYCGLSVRPVTDVYNTELSSSDVADMSITGFDSNWE